MTFQQAVENHIRRDMATARLVLDRSALHTLTIKTTSGTITFPFFLDEGERKPATVTPPYAPYQPNTARIVDGICNQENYIKLSGTF